MEKRRYYPSSHRLSVNILLNNITFFWLLLFSMHESLHVPVKLRCIYTTVFFTARCTIAQSAVSLLSQKRVKLYTDFKIIWLVHSQGLSEQKTHSKFQRKGNVGVSSDCRNFFEYPLLSEERIKPRTSNFVRIFTGSIRTKTVQNFGKISRGRRDSGLSNIFRAPIYGVHRAVIFVVVHLSCVVGLSISRLTVFKIRRGKIWKSKCITNLNQAISSANQSIYITPRQHRNTQ